MNQTDEKYLARLRARYRKASKKERSAILNEYVKTTGCHRKYATSLLRGKRKRGTGPIHRPRRSIYGEAECYHKLLQISPAPIDRLLARYRLGAGKSRSFTKPGTWLKARIPIRTWADWNEDRPGFCEMDLVDHSGGRIIRGADHAWTLCFTDVTRAARRVSKTAWTACVAVPNKAQVHVFATIEQARRRLPFPLLGIDSDNGSEFINKTVAKLLNKLLIRFTKCRPRHTNDNGLVESKNGSVVRKQLGYVHIPQVYASAINQYHRDFLNVYVNFHRPCFFAVSVVDHRGKVKKTYPYQEVMTPYEKLKSLSGVQSYLRPGVTLEKLDDIAYEMSDNEFAERMVKAHSNLFQHISRHTYRGV